MRCRTFESSNKVGIKDISEDSRGRMVKGLIAVVTDFVHFLFVL
jgi:hypothetical protein